MNYYVARSKCSKTGEELKVAKQTWKDNRLIRSVAVTSREELSVVPPKRSALEIAVEPCKTSKRET